MAFITTSELESNKLRWQQANSNCNYQKENENRDDGSRCSISDEEPLSLYRFLLGRLQICLKPLVNNNQRFFTKDVKLTQTVVDHYCSRLVTDYVIEFNKRTECQNSKDELDEGYIVWVLKEFTSRGVWLQGKIVKAHRGAKGIARSFDMQTATRIIQGPAVSPALYSHNCQVFQRVTESIALNETNSKTQKKICAVFYLCCCRERVAGSVKKPSSFIFFRPPYQFVVNQKNVF